MTRSKPSTAHHQSHARHASYMGIYGMLRTCETLCDRNRTLPNYKHPNIVQLIRIELTCRFERIFLPHVTSTLSLVRHIPYEHEGNVSKTFRFPSPRILHSSNTRSLLQKSDTQTSILLILPLVFFHLRVGVYGARAAPSLKLLDMVSKYSTYVPILFSIQHVRSYELLRNSVHCLFGLCCESYS